MAVPIAHFATGMAVPFGLAALIRLFGRRKPHPGIVYVPVAMLACGVWAVLPKVLGTAAPPLGRLCHVPVLGDVFFFYATLSRVESGGSAWGTLAFVGMWVVVIVGYLIRLRGAD